MKTVAIIQARMGSTRLPGKVMLPLLGVPVIEQIYRRVSRSMGLARVVVAIPRKDYPAMRDAYIPFQDWFLYDGDEADLVGRYLACATRMQADLMVRVPGDNPCVDPAYIDAAVAAYQRDPFVYYSNTTAYVGDVAVDGIGVEVCSYSRLQWLDQRTQGCPDWREHPHRYFMDSRLLALPKADVRLDVNTQAEYEFIADLYAHFQRNDFTAQEVLTLIDRTKVHA